MAVLVLGTYRDTELSHSHPLLNTLAALQRQVKVTRLELTGLSNTAVVALMEAMAGERRRKVSPGRSCHLSNSMSFTGRRVAVIWRG